VQRDTHRGTRKEDGHTSESSPCRTAEPATLAWPRWDWGKESVIFLGMTTVIVALAYLPSAGEGGAHAVPGEQLPVWTLFPFLLLLLCIALLPLTVPHWWESNTNKAVTSATLALPIMVYLGVSWQEAGLVELLEKMREYVSFLCLLGSLYVISGGIYIAGSLSGTPLMNTALLALGAVLANIVGTTGASMLLVRPLLRANAARQKKAHILVFFIFIVSNTGGLLTPLGDPPLFLGFLKGVPFSWTFHQFWQPWLALNGALLVLFHFWDEAVFDREERERPGSQLEEVQVHEPIKIFGRLNFLLLGGVIAVIYASGQGIGNGGHPWPFGLQEGGMLILAMASYYVLTHETTHERNQFSFAPIEEVAILFAGIFITMAPALLLLNAYGKTWEVNQPWQFFWASGLLSSFLDNAPTYLTFSAIASGVSGIPVEGRYLALLLQHPLGVQLLQATALGSVCMGANSYIGNGPNFMVKAVAEQAGIKMPSFFGYMGYSVGILIPLFVVLSLVLFSS
jgi:Na+/H+ antiporter NhaD/arsenite permease-like protein